MFLSSCANDSSAWSPLLTNSTEISVDSHMDEENNLESQVMFGHLENTLAVRCLARNEMAVVSREVKLVSNGKNTHTRVQLILVFIYLFFIELTFDVVVCTSSLMLRVRQCVLGAGPVLSVWQQLSYDEFVVRQLIGAIGRDSYPNSYCNSGKPEAICYPPPPHSPFARALSPSPSPHLHFIFPAYLLGPEISRHATGLSASSDAARRKRFIVHYGTYTHVASV